MWFKLCFELATKLKLFKTVAVIENSQKWEDSLLELHRTLRKPTGTISSRNLLIHTDSSSLLESDDHGYNSLHWAAIGGNYNAIKFIRLCNLVDQKSWTECLTKEGKTAIELAAEMNHFEICQILLEDFRSLRESIKTNIGEKLLVNAAKYSNIQITYTIVNEFHVIPK